MFGLAARKASAPSAAPGFPRLLASLVGGYGALVLAPKDPRARAFSVRMERLAAEAAGMAGDPAFLGRLGERAREDVESFAEAQRREVERTLEALDAGLRRGVRSLDDALRAGDAVAGCARTTRDRLGQLDRVGSYAELREEIERETRRLGEAVRLHGEATAAAREAMKGELAHLRERLAEAETMVGRDPLTGLANRAGFDRVLAGVADPERRVVAILDLDGFKGVNDTYGHGAGDDGLALFARRLVATVGRAATAARIGGDEFAVLAEDSEAHLTSRLRTLEESLKTDPLTVEGTPLPFGLSFGVAPLESERPSRSLAAADGRMYLYKKAKGAGRAA